MSKGRPRAFDRDEALGRATLVFWRHGYDATSIAQLTRAMGINAPSLYAAFGDKRALFTEALDYYMKNYGAFTVGALRDEPDARAAIEKLLLGAAKAFTTGDHPPGCMVITAATNCTPESAAIEKRLRAIRSSTVEALAQKIAGGTKPPLPPATVRTLARFFSATLQGMSAEARDGASHAELEAVARAALRAWPS